MISLGGVVVDPGALWEGRGAVRVGGTCMVCKALGSPWTLAAGNTQEPNTSGSKPVVL